MAYMRCTVRAKDVDNGMTGSLMTFGTGTLHKKSFA